MSGGQIQTSDANATISRTVTIANGQTTSSQIDLRAIRNSTDTLSGNVPVLTLQMPAAFTGTSISFQVSCDGGTTFQTLYDDNGTAISVAVSASRTISCPSLGAVDAVQLVSNASEGAARSIVVKAGAGGPTIQRAAGASGATVTVSQLPTAAALADATANPTTSLIGSLLEGFNGTTWDRLRTFATGVLQVFSGANTSVLATAVTVTSSATQLPASPLANRKNITIFNNDTTLTMVVGGSGVTFTTGVPILPQSAMSFDLGPGALIYGIVSSTSVNCRVVEAS